ncbi:histidine kinase [Xaviernesmea oryzae]|uniref:histidine kinase n=1 Tax=Xaviernesmea oryzae TaxID=464029 RepID=A0A1Q9AY51_9HYPH|nr:response regulator [Xaviernesmea oryzae]OLP60359.1 histidine kinase [Xaviernesmea oryzae]SEK21690.1 multi-sensor hybrid histidine kinase [Xaviernesmea oryzae]
MKAISEGRFDPWLHAILIGLTVAPFIVDIMMPLGTAIWLVYILAIALSSLTSRPAIPLVIAAAATVLIVVGFMLAPAGVNPEIARVNRSLCVIIGWIMALSGYAFIRNKVEMRRSQWLRQGQVGMAARVSGEQSVEQLADNVLTYLVDYVGAQGAALFVNREGRFQRMGAYGLPADAPVPSEIAPGDGLIGQVAKDGRLIDLHEVPENYLYVGSALGRGLPRRLLIAPAGTDGTIHAVIELGFLKPVDHPVEELLRQLSDKIAIAIRSAEYRGMLRRLLEETRQQADELRAQSDELRAANDELEAQSRILQDSQARLEHQQAELEQNNAELEAQTNELTAQRDELTRARTELERQARDLEQGSRYKSEFLSNMSHELRTPLNSLLILAQLLAENKAGNLTEEQVKFARTIGSAGNDLLVLINDILDISKIEAGQVELQMQPVAIADLLAKLKGTFDPTAVQKGLDLQLAINPAVPTTLVTDPQRLEQVLKNFLSNALKFTHRGEVALTVARQGDGLAFSVRDSGIGISADHLATIFEPFRQADGTISRKYGGTGLGLSISRELGALLGGRITVSSEEGKGSTFTLILPIDRDLGLAENTHEPTRRMNMDAVLASSVQAEKARDAAPFADMQAPAMPIRDDRATLRAGERMLLAVEDDPAFAEILYDLAHDLGFQCIVAGTADDGVVLARQYLPHAIILDIGLPDHTGLFVLDRLKHDLRTRHIPVHVVSGADYALKARALGAAGYTLKPVKREELAHALEGLENNLQEPVRRVLVVEDDATQLESVELLLGSRNVTTVGVKTAAECIERLSNDAFDCMVLDLTLPDASGLDVLDHLRENSTLSFPPVIVYTGRELSADDELRLRRYAKSIIIKGAKSPERLLDEVTLFLHQVVSALPNRQQEMLAKSLNRDETVEGRRILVVEDDVRNVYALTSIFEAHGAMVTIARNGLEALSVIEKGLAEGGTVPFDLVLMDVMMPEMDGLTATREIRSRFKLNHLPIIMLTAKAMPQDQVQCLAAGANDYVTKPLDVDKLLSLVRVWISR